MKEKYWIVVAGKIRISDTETRCEKITIPYTDYVGSKLNEVQNVNQFADKLKKLHSETMEDVQTQIIKRN